MGTLGGATSIDGVEVRPLRQIHDDRGRVMHMLRNDDEHFAAFGEIYFSTVYPGVVKGWHRHREMTLNYAVVVGAIQLGLFDDRPGSPTHGQVDRVFPGETNYVLVTVPPGVWNGFKGLGTTTSIVANCATLPHDPAEIERRDPFDAGIPYSWDVRHG